ncbi:aryl-alcohol oxidase-like protein [Pleurotus eryngii]|uniref:Aryl-alcohol oxidase-like protein n=1 Tax=Pleurotus eryngii TaxID=5323 RepID=A0A9P5ZSE2_PLEER|nr:aryl-alcohol oxidase-like protein [Pleurotus eryngii]
MFPTFGLFSLALLAAKGAIGALLTDPTQLTTTTYDYVIVGAGTAGSVLAARLTEDALVRVLVVEAGRSNEGSDNANIRIPFNAPLASPGTSFDWNFTTVNQPSLNNEPEPYPRGKVLGGSSSTNYLVYTRGSADDYDRLAAIAGDDGWTWENLHPYILKHNSIVAPADGHDTTGEFDPAWHGNGPLLTSVAGYPAVIDPLVIGTTQEAAEFPYNVDGNSGNPLGISWVQSTIANGTRQSSAIAYLWPALNRPNLDVLIHTQATRLIQTGRTGATPIFRSVEFATGPSAPRFRATARREVILSAGSVGTPQLLQLSGIGNRETLSALGINTILNNADVGEHLQDHPFIPLQWEVNSNETFDQLFYDADLSAAALNQWNTNHTGPLSTNPVMNHIGFLRIPDDNAIWQENEDPSAGPNSPHYEIAFGNCFVTTSAQTVPSSGGFMTITPIVVSPSSRGYVRLSTSNPFDAPLIDPGFFSNDLDMAIMIEAVKASQRYVATSSWSNFIIGPYIDSANTTTPEDIIEYTRQRTATTRHPTGTAQVGKVVNGDLTVKDISGVRIVDASIFPHVPSAHTQAPTYIIAERAADLIKAAYH